MTPAAIAALQDAWRHLEELPGRHAREMLNAQYDWNRKIRDCDHIRPNGETAVEDGWCTICGRYSNEFRS